MRTKFSWFAEIVKHIAPTIRNVTGSEPPPSPVDATTYTQHGFPWFQLYDEALRDVPASGRFERVKGVRERQAEREQTSGEIDRTVNIPGAQVRPLKVGRAGRETEKEETDSGSE